MADRRVTVTIAAQDSFSSVLNQYQQKMGQAEQATRKVEQSTGGLEAGFRRMQQAFDIGIAGAMISRTVDFAEGMNRLGTEVRANRAVFAQLTSEIGGQEAVMRSLRDATGGVTDDLTLMGAANQLLRLNIVENSDDLSTLVGQIQRLKQPTESTTEAIRNFALMLSNESLLRLDSFGISSANVKRAMDELNISFREAVQIEMDKQIERLGAAADVNVTAVARLQTRWDNFWNSFGERLSIGVEALANFADVTNTILGDKFSESRRITEYLQSRNIQPEQPGLGVLTLTGLLSGGVTDYSERQIDMARRVLAQRDAIQALSNSMQRGVGAVRDWYQAEAQGLMDAQRAWEQHQPFYRAMAGIDEMTTQARSIAGAMTGGMEVPRFLTDSQAAEIERYYERIRDTVEYTKETMGDLLTDDDLAALDRAEATMKDMADDARDAAAAFRDMSLTDIFGTSGGGLLGEITDQFERWARDQGMTDEQLAPYLSALNLQSGRETPFSRAFEEQFLPATRGMTPDEVSQYFGNFIASMQYAGQTGTPFANLPQFGLSTFGGVFGGGTRDLTIGMGQGINEVLAQNPWLTREQLMAAAGTGGGRYIRAGTFQVPTGQIMEGFDPQGFLNSIIGSLNTELGGGDTFGIGGLGTVMDEAATSASEIDTYMTSIGETISTFSGELIGVFSQKYTLNLDVVANLPDWLRSAIRDGSSLVELVGAAIQTNGGTTPGETQSVARGGRVIEQ